MRTVSIINLLFIIMIGNVLHAGQEVALKAVVESGPHIITSFTDLKDQANKLAKLKFLKSTNSKTSGLKVPQNIQVSQEIIDNYICEKMNLRKKFKCVNCLLNNYGFNKEIIVEYIQSRSPDSYKKLSEQLIVIFCLEELKELEYSESGKQELESAKFKIERELEQQLYDWIDQRRRNELHANKREGHMGLIVFLAVAAFVGYGARYVYGC